ncbi:MAG: response regulator [Fimbriimonadaceae bacterium]|nr:response regulator [Chitinophagales bacterium]
MQPIKLKLTFAFLISLAAIGTAVYFAYTSFSNLEESVRVLAKPDSTVKMLNDVVNNLIASENEMRIYSINVEEEALDNYISHMDSINTLLDTLRSLPSFTAINKDEIDTLLDLLQSKADLMYVLVAIKNDPGAKQLATKAMDEVSTAINETDALTKKYTDSIRNAIPDIKESTLIEQSADTTQTENEKKEKKLLGIFKVKNKPKKVKNTSEENTAAETQTETETPTVESDAIASNPTVDPDELRQILYVLSKEEDRYAQKLSKQELDIIAGDKIIMGKIRRIISDAEKFQRNMITENVQKASEKAKQSSSIIFGISLAALLAGIIFMGIIISDINKSNKYKTELETAKDNAEYHAKAKEIFLANMSHEIRTPLNAIIGFSEQLQFTDLKEDQDEYLQAVQGASEHLLNIVNDILDLTKIEAGKIIVQKNIFSVADVIGEVAHIMQVKANEKRIGLEYFYDEESNNLVRGDDFRLKQVLYNLIGNAIKFTHQGLVRITSNALTDDPYMHFTIEIKDSGIGISEEKLKNIFDDFTQADATTTKRYGGTGLGLSISKKLIELQNGSIAVSSLEGEGSVFTIRMRYRIPSDKQIAAFTKETQSHQIIPAETHILVVDDEPFNLSLAAVIFKKHNITNTCVSSALDALKLFETTKFDIVFADLHMPEEDGFSFAKKIRSINRKIPLIAMTANVMHDERELLTASGFNDIITKPYREQDFINKIIAWANNSDPDYGINYELIKQNGIAEHTNHKEVIPENDFLKSGSYSLDEIVLFTAADDQLMLSVIHSFVESNKINLEVLSVHFKNKDIRGINNITHKMLPGYNHFRIHTLIPVLKKLEIMQTIHETELQKEIDLIKIVSENIFVELTAEIKRLEEKQPA